MIIGFAGKAGAGKDTAAEAILQENPLAYCTSFARALKVKVKNDFGLSGSDVFSNSGKERETKYRDADGSILKVRDLLQRVGVFYRSIDPNYWVNACFNDFQSKFRVLPDIVITDVRFPNEARAIQDAGGVVIRVNVSPEVQATRVKNIDHAHISETALDNYERFDFFVDGNLPLDKYMEVVRYQYRKIIGGSH